MLSDLEMIRCDRLEQIFFRQYMMSGMPSHVFLIDVDDARLEVWLSGPVFGLNYPKEDDLQDHWQ